MIKNTSMILVLNIFLLSGMANAEQAAANVQDAAGEAKSDQVSTAKDVAQPDKKVTSGEITSGGENPAAGGAVAKSEYELAAERSAEEADREMAAYARAAHRDAARKRAAEVRAAQREAARKRAASIRAAQEEAAMEMAARVRAAREEAAKEMAARVKAAREEAARERAARERAYIERKKRYQAEREYYNQRDSYYRAPY